MKFKVLAVDFYIVGENITSASFYNASSFFDYDAVVIDPINVSDAWKNVQSREDGSLRVYADLDKGFSKTLIAIMEQRTEETKLLLEKAGGIVVCFLRRKEPVLNYKPSYSPYQNFIHRYSWLSQKEYSCWEKTRGQGVWEYREKKMRLLKNGARMSRGKQKFPGVTLKFHKVYLIEKSIRLGNLANW